MSTWIKMRKSLWNDPRVLSIATKLHQAKPTVIGGLFALWSLADTHGESFKGISTQVLDAEIGIEGFCAALPRDWFVTRGNRIELPNYSAHNGTTAKTRALVSKRVEKHREESSNADVTREPLPDQDQTRKEQKEKQPPPTGDDSSAIRAYAKAELNIDLQTAVVNSLLVDFGLVGVVETLDHLASRPPSTRFKGVTSPVGFLRSLAKKAKAGRGSLDREDHEYEPFENWRTRMNEAVEAKLAKVGRG